MKNKIESKMRLICGVMKGEFELNKKKEEQIIVVPASIYYLDSGEVVEIRYPNKNGIAKILDGDDSEYEYDELCGMTKEGYPQYPKEGEIRPYQAYWNMLVIDVPVKIKNIEDDIEIIYPNLKSYLYL